MFFSIKTQIIMWLVASLVVVPLIETLGLNRPRGADKDLSPDELEEAWRTRLRQAFEYLAMIGGTMGVIALMQHGMRGEGPAALYGIFVIFLWTIGFIIALIVLSVVGHFLSGQIRTGYHVALCALFVIGFVLTRGHDQAQDKAAVEKRVSLASEYIGVQKEQRMQWRADLENAGAYGAEGVVPPMLEVLDSGDGVQVTNISDQTLCLDLRRSLAKLGPGYDYQCALWSERGGLHSCVDYAPGHTEWLHMSQRPDLPSCSGEPLEFRVGEWRKDTIAWWSDAALEDFDQQTERLETDANFLASTFDPPSFRSEPFMREVMSDIRAKVVGPPRVAQWIEQIAAAEQKRGTVDTASPANHAEQAEKVQKLNEIREAQAKVQAIKSLRERLSRNRKEDREREYPDYLPVEDNLDSATVTHPLGAVFYVQLARVGRDSSGQEFVCEMHGQGRGTEFGTYVSKSQTGYFTVASRDGPCADPANSTLQMVVHDFDGRLTFASPGALDRLQAEAEARVLALDPSTLQPVTSGR
jgi:hypothetical protein